MGAKASKKGRSDSSDSDEEVDRPAFEKATVSLKYEVFEKWDLSATKTKATLRTVDDSELTISESETIREPTQSFHLKLSDANEVFGASPWYIQGMKSAVSAMQIDFESNADWLIMWSVLVVKSSEYLCLDRINPKLRIMEQVRWKFMFEARDSLRDYMFSPNGRTLAVVTGACSMFCRLPKSTLSFKIFGNHSTMSLFDSETRRMFQWQNYEGMHVCRFISDTTLVCSGSAFSEQGRQEFLSICNPVCKPVPYFDRDYLFILDLEDDVVYSMSEEYYRVKEYKFETCGMNYLIAQVNGQLSLFHFEQRPPHSNSENPRKGLLLNQKPYDRKIGYKWHNRLQEYGSNSSVSEPSKIISQGISGKFLCVMTDKDGNIAIINVPTLDEQWYLETSSFKLDFNRTLLCGLGLVCLPDNRDRRQYYYDKSRVNPHLKLLELPVYDYIAIFQEMLPFVGFIDGICRIVMEYWCLPDVSPDNVRVLVKDFPGQRRGFQLADGIDKILLVGSGDGSMDVSYMSYRLFEETSVEYTWQRCFRYFEKE